MTSVSNIPESEFEKFCEQDSTDEATTTQEEYRNKARALVVQVDDQLGSLLSRGMCSYLCACDISTIP